MRAESQLPVLPVGTPVVGIPAGTEMRTHVQTRTRSCGYGPVAGTGTGMGGDTRGYTRGTT